MRRQTCSSSPIAFYAALRDTAHELGLGFFAGSYLARADFSDVADAGRGGILRNRRLDHAVARGEIRGQWRADGHYAARHRRRGGQIGRASCRERVWSSVGEWWG